MRKLSLIAAGLTGGMLVLYIGLLARQGPPFLSATTAGVIGILVALAGLTAYGFAGRYPRQRALALWAAVPGFLGLGILAMFSIGVFLLLTGVVTLAAAVAASRGIEMSLRPVVVWAAVIIAAWAAAFGLLFLSHSLR